MKKIEKFNYQPIPSSHKGFKEVLVTFDYKGKTIHYYSFVKENAKLSGKQYIAEAKKEIEELTRNGKLVKYAKKYLHYPVKESEDIKVVTVAKTAQKGAASNKVVSYSNAAPRVKKPYRPFLAMWIFGLICLAGAGTLIVLNLINTNTWPIWLLPDEKAKVDFFYLISIGLGALAIVLLAVGIPLYISKHRKYKRGHVTAPKAEKKK